MRSSYSMLPVLLLVCVLGLTACGSVLPGRDRGSFMPRDDFPVPPNVERLMGPEDCRGSTLSAVQAALPDYPASAWSRGRQGWIVMRFDVQADGSVDRVRVARAVPDGPFNRISRRAVRNWRFQPLDGVAVLQNCVVMFEFRAGEVAIR